MKTKTIVWTAVIAVVIAGGGYAAFDYLTGNRIEVKQVISANAPANASAQGTIAGSKVDGKWNIQSGSEVYFSIKTSKDTVNYVVKSVKGSWVIDSKNPSGSTGEGSADMKTLDSGNVKRDDHLKTADYFDIEKFPTADFKLKSVEGLPSEWKEGVKAPIKLNGTMQIRGFSKDVVFTSDAVLDKDQLKLEGKTVVTFADFGLKNPHAVVLETENDITIQLRLILQK